MFRIRHRPPVPQRGAVIFALQVLLVVLIPVLDDGQDLTSPAYAAAFIAVAVYSVLLLGYRSTAATLAVGGVAAIVWTLLVAGESPLLRLPLLFVLITGALVASALCIKASFSLRVPSMQRIFCGAASYVMLGFVFAGIHGINYQLFHAGYDILNGAGQTSHLRWVHFLWLSFATLTTAGFGDVAPTSSTACAIATLEGLCGILFPSTLIARIASISAEDRSE